MVEATAQWHMQGELRPESAPSGMPGWDYDEWKSSLMRNRTRVFQDIDVELCPDREVPTTMHIAALRDGRLRVARAIEVTVEVVDGQFVVQSDELSEYGSGETVIEALEDFQGCVAELYHGLNARRERLGPDLQRVWTRLQEFIVPAIAPAL